MSSNFLVKFYLFISYYFLFNMMFLAQPSIIIISLLYFNLKLDYNNYFKLEVHVQPMSFCPKKQQIFRETNKPNPSPTPRRFHQKFFIGQIALLSQYSFISTPLSGKIKSLSGICSPETQNLNEKIQEELSPLDDVPNYHFPKMFNREEDKMQYQVQTIQFFESQESQMLEAILNYKKQCWDIILPINEFVSEESCQGFWILKIITKKYIELNNYDNDKELVQFCLKLLNRNLHINHDDIVLQLDGGIRINPYCLFKKVSIRSSISNLLKNLLFEHKISNRLQIFQALFQDFENKDLDSLKRQNHIDFQFKYLKETLINKLLGINK
ncbi:unnamed protein product (macronuclear) [Paramecium tetraurelia]|uniref:Uncharacterized protein n=1 Tax=Paramecium tetraurelia TaxID=5888 RepID=A0BKH3_PARTE|nr:uncharacterized protein GSPATT00029671001 [Paramecium tetraurelia]CAK59040.1 unnamed protein product [Paramecium tetraurelia]|eukprot:XP_001426438.1 hypothetical protein (macronuclear) [Paramecium tetraurelia strain d4-2]